MDKVKKRSLVITNTLSVVLFAAGLILTILPFWLEMAKLGLFGNQLALDFKLPTYYYIMSFLFLAVLCVLTVFAYKLKNKLLALLPLCYLLFTIFVFICLAILMTSPNTEIYVLYIAAFSCIAPLYGFCEITYVWSLFVLLPLFFASIIVTYKVFKFTKEEKSNQKKKK